MEEGMRSRRLMFALIPSSFRTKESENEYISKFQRLLDYLGKLREKEESDVDLQVEIISSETRGQDEPEGARKVSHNTSDSMIRFLVQLRKGKRDPFEWTEVAIDSVFDTARSFRISFNWYVYQRMILRSFDHVLMLRFAKLYMYVMWWIIST